MDEIYVTITKDEYEELIRGKEKLSIIRRIAKVSKYMSMEDLKNIIGEDEE